MYRTFLRFFTRVADGICCNAATVWHTVNYEYISNAALCGVTSYVRNSGNGRKYFLEFSGISVLV